MPTYKLTYSISNYFLFLVFSYNLQYLAKLCLQNSKYWYQPFISYWPCHANNWKIIVLPLRRHEYESSGNKMLFNCIIFVLIIDFYFYKLFLFFVIVVLVLLHMVFNKKYLLN